jgi:phenylacetate-CoA ligase
MYRPQMEAASREVLQALQLRLLQNQIRYVYEHSPMYKQKYDEVGLEPGDIKTLEDVGKIPFTTKEDLRKSQEENPPFGDFLCVPPQEGVRVFKTTGTTGEPIRVILTAKDWFGVTCEQVAFAAHGYGLKKSDIAFLPFGYSTVIAWWTWQVGLESLGVTVVPGGTQSSKERIKNIIEWKATFICGTPTYIIHLGNVAKEMGIDLAKQSQVRIVILGGEPGAEIPATRKLVEEMWGGKCYDVMGSSEMPACWGFECFHQKGLHLIENMFFPEVINPNTGEPTVPGEQGELVMSNLCMETMPLIRYRMRDIVKLNYDQCDCGRTFARLEGGILGRADDMIPFAGVNIYPSGIENFVRGLKQFSTEFQIIVPKVAIGKRLKIRVEPASASILENELKQASASLMESIKWKIGITPEIEITSIGSLPRFEVKAKRVIKEE